MKNCMMIGKVKCCEYNNTFGGQFLMKQQFVNYMQFDSKYKAYVLSTRPKSVSSYFMRDKNT